MSDVAVAQLRAQEAVRGGGNDQEFNIAGPSEPKGEWMSCLDLLDFNITCCNHDFSTGVPPRIRLTVRILSALSFIFVTIQFIVGGMVSAFFTAKDGQVVQGCWWVGLVWLISSIAGINSQNKAHLMVAAVFSIVGVPIGIGGAASDGQAYFNYTDSPPLGCAQLTPQALPDPNPNDDGPAVSSARRFLRALQSASAPKSPQGGSSLQITSYGPSPSSNAVAYSCLVSQYNSNPAAVSASTCVCTVAASELQSAGMECQQFILANSAQNGNCGTIFSTYLPQLKASVGLASFLIILNTVIFFLCCIVLCTFVRKDSSVVGGDGQDDIPKPQKTTTTTDRRSTVFEAFMAVSPVKWLMNNPLHESDESQKHHSSSNTGGTHIAFVAKPDVIMRPQSSRLSFSNKAAPPQPNEAESPDLDDFQDAIEERPPSVVVADQEEEEDDGRVSSSSTQTNAPGFSAGVPGIAERYLGQLDVDSSPETPRATKQRSASVASKYLEAVGSSSNHSGGRERATTTFK